MFNTIVYGHICPPPPLMGNEFDNLRKNILNFEHKDLYLVIICNHNIFSIQYLLYRTFHEIYTYIYGVRDLYSSTFYVISQNRQNK